VGTAAILNRFGLTVALAALPVMCIGGLLLCGAVPTLAVVSSLMVVERITAFGLSGPGMRVLYTVVEPDEKYKAQNFIDTVVYRGGDALSGWLKESGLAPAMMLAILLPIAGVWLYACLALERMHWAKVGEFAPVR
jgi:ATP:ADP antiporter, AAA family